MFLEALCVMFFNQKDVHAMVYCSTMRNVYFAVIYSKVFFFEKYVTYRCLFSEFCTGSILSSISYSTRPEDLI